MHELQLLIQSLTTKVHEQNKRIEAIEEGAEVDLTSAPDGVNMSNVVRVIADVKTELMTRLASRE